MTSNSAKLCEPNVWLNGAEKSVLTFAPWIRDGVMVLLKLLAVKQIWVAPGLSHTSYYILATLKNKM